MMSNILKIIAAVICGYFIGAFSFSITMSEYVFKTDVRKKGSGNAGATNMARAFGILPGIITLVGDFLKTVLAIYLGKALAGNIGFALAGIACLIGHCYPVYYGFKGGKGVSSGLAALFVCDWRCAVAALIVFLIIAFAFKKVSAASLSGALTGLIVAIVLGLPWHKLLLIVFAVALLFFRHEENIRRLIKGTEPDFRVSRDK